MKTRIVPVHRLSPSQKTRMFEIMQAYYVEVTEDAFRRDLHEKDDVILLFSRDGEVQGFSTLLNVSLVHRGRKCFGIFSGDTVLDSRYWGNGALAAAFGRYLVRSRLRRPFHRVYWFLISKGYKTYLLMTNNFSTHYPRCETPTPDFYQELLDAFYAKRFDTNYDRETGIIKPHGPKVALKTNVAEILPQHLAHPRIRFFADKNPRWRDGVELACIARVTLAVPLLYTLKRVAKFLRSRRPLALNPTPALTLEANETSGT